MKKCLMIVFVAAVCMIVLMTPVFAADDIGNDLIENSGVKTVLSAFDKQTEEYLNEIGLGNLNIESIFSVQPSRVLTTVFSMLKTALRDSQKELFTIAAIVLLSALAVSINEHKRSEQQDIFSLCCTALLVFSLLVPIRELIAAGEQIIVTAGSVCAGVIPVMCILFASGGKNTISGMFSMTQIPATQIVVSIFSGIFIPSSNMLLAVGMAGSIGNQLLFRKIMPTIKKYIFVAFSTIAGVYFSVLGLKTGLASAADATAVKALKLTAGNFVPVIGNAISDSASVVIASLSLTKTSIGAFSLIAIAFLFLPLLIKLVLWLSVLEISAAVAASFSLDSAKNMLQTIHSCLAVYAVMVVFSALMILMNLGLLTMIRG